MTDKLISAERITKYAVDAARINALKHEHEAQREQFLSEMDRGYLFEATGPWLLRVNNSRETEINWKIEFRNYLVRRYSRNHSLWLSQAMAERYIRTVESLSHRKTIITLTPTTNPNYNRKEEDRIILVSA